MKFLLPAIETGTDFAQKNILRLLANAALTKYVGLMGRQLRNEEAEANGGEPAAKDYTNKIYATVKLHNDLVAALDERKPTKWDEAMTLESLLEFMTREAQPLDPKLVEAARAQFNMSDEDIQRMMSMQSGSEQAQLAQQVPELIRAYNDMLASTEPIKEDLDDIDWINLLGKVNEKARARVEQLVAKGLQQRKNGLMTWAGELDALRKSAILEQGRAMSEANADTLTRMRDKGIELPSFEN